MLRTRNGLKGRDAEALHRQQVIASPIPVPAPVRVSAGGRPAHRLQDAWCSYLGPAFTDNASCYFTGTYREEYGLERGLMLPRNVHKDFRRFLKAQGIKGDFMCGVEPHRYRAAYRDGPWRSKRFADILHLHAIVAGPFTPAELPLLAAEWGVDRGFARALPVLDGGLSYVTKYVLKHDTDAFDWRLSSPPCLSPSGPRAGHFLTPADAVIPPTASGRGQSPRMSVPSRDQRTDSDLSQASPDPRDHLPGQGA